MMKKHLLHGIVAGILSTIMGMIYVFIHQQMTLTDFSQLINLGSVAGASIFGCMLMAMGYFLIEKFNRSNLKGWMNIVIAIFSFVSILGPFTISIPLEMDFPELFPSLVVPIHFFPAMIFFGLDSFFQKKR